MTTNKKTSPMTPDAMRRYVLARIEKAMPPLSDAMFVLGRLSASSELTSEEGITADTMLTDVTSAYAKLFEIILPAARLEALIRQHRQGEGDEA